MPQIIIKYSSSKTLKILKTLSSYLDFTFEKQQKVKKKEYAVKGVSFIPGDRSIDISEMNSIFTGKNIDSKSLREKAWQQC